MTAVKAPAVIVTLATAVLVVLHQHYAPPGERLAEAADQGVFLELVGIWTVLAVPVFFLFPRIRAMRGWRVPSTTYFVPLWLVRLWLAGLVGFTFGCSILAAFQDLRVFWLAGSFLAVSIALWLGAFNRFRHAEAEYEIPWFRWIYRDFTRHPRR